LTLQVDTASKLLHAFGERHQVSIGRGGAVPELVKREGDGATPLGTFRLETLMLRPDRADAPRTKLPWRWLRMTDGWCDAPDHPDYNRPVSHPFEASAERLWRDDHAYDLLLVLSHNQHPVRPGAGSAIFWHLAQPDWRPTEGCIAMARHAFEALLPRLAAGMVLEIR
jgi:L,D-peptidoglycan transpeptidase YkuD (ErfK/YbiS/YcfS/YnhG family)